MQQITDSLLIAWLLSELGIDRNEAEERILLMTLQGEKDAEQEA